ncbi:MAG: hypothetical protein Tsb0017_24780 [Geothermobacteraceae bacterium]
MRILIAEVHDENREMLHGVLTNAGYQVETAVEGRAAWELFSGNRPDLVLWNRDLPGLGALQLAERIKADTDRQRVYLVLLAGRENADDLAQALEGGVDDLLLLPCDAVELLARIRAGERLLLRQRRAQPKEGAEDLLQRIFPEAVARRLGDRGEVIADSVAQATLLSVGLHGFDRMVADHPAMDMVALLNRFFCRLDDLADRHGLDKIRTVAGSYLLAGGVVAPCPDHAARVAVLALAIQEEAGALIGPGGEPVRLQIGIESGPLVAGVVGNARLSYDVWGEIVHCADELRLCCPPGSIQVGEGCRRLLTDRFILEKRGDYYLPGTGTFATYLLCGMREEA